MNFHLVLVSLVCFFYLVAFLLYLIKFYSINENRFQWTAHLLEIAFFIQTLGIFIHAFSSETDLHLPVANVAEASGFFAWSLAFVYLLLARQIKTETFPLILIPILLLFLVPSFFPLPASAPPQAYLHDTYFLAHILSAFFGYASFALSFIAAVLYLFLDISLKRKKAVSLYQKFPSLEDLEHFIFRTISWGLILLGGAIISGAFWAKSTFGTYVLLEPKYFSTLLTWAAYLVIIYLHSFLQVKGRRIVRMSLFAFMLVLVTFWGTSLFKSGFHIGIW